MIQIAFLFDRTNDWLKHYLPSTLAERQEIRIQPFYNHEEIEGYDVVFVLGYTKIIRGQFLAKNKHILLVHDAQKAKR